MSEISSEKVFNYAETEEFSSLALSIQGLSHKKENTPLQDCNAISILPNKWIAVAVADGVGSEPHSDIGAQMAVNAFSDFVSQNWGYYEDEKSVINLLRAAFLNVLGDLNYTSAKERNKMAEYSTTLHAAIIADVGLFYAHSGDGGIIALTNDGNIIPITNPQKAGEYREYVIPVNAGPKEWEFGYYKREVQSVMLCTDGVYDKLCDKMLKSHGYEIDVPLTSVFLSPWSFDYSIEKENILNCFFSIFRGENGLNDLYTPMAYAIAQSRDKSKIDDAAFFIRDNLYLNKMYHYNRIHSIYDDITVAVIQRKNCFPEKKNKDYFGLPDLESIYKKNLANLYNTDTNEK